MSAFIQQLPALIGVVVGALGSYLAIVRGDKVRFRREQTARWEERRLTVYSDYARVLKKSVTLTYRVSAHLGNDPHPHPLSPEEAAPQLVSALEARSALPARQRAARERYYSAVRDDLALPPGHSGRWIFDEPASAGA
ncbi:hypothetical protein [Streptomyces sp. NPDC058694]|uniref:hypothetical protein n=1 Tax=Streptomyces sp. NPDC058694 TaxID=3346603 RepID=UPI003665C01B